MVGSKRLIALDIGAAQLTMAEFVVRRDGTPELRRYGVKDLGIEPDNETTAAAYVTAGIRELMHEQGIKPGPLLLAISGQIVFPRYVKLPPVSRDKVQQIVQYEAEQNVPFPINEVVWDHQLIEGEDIENNVMIVAVKSDIVKELTDAVEDAGLEPTVVDVAPFALYNAVRHSYPDDTGCTMVLDIRMRTTNLVFVEGARVFSRSIPVAGNTIIRELMKEYNISRKDAVEVLQEKGYVSLGGVTGSSDDQMADQIAKIIRGIMTRLHAEVNRSVNFYRSQQGGSPPGRALLSGQYSTLPQLDDFFAEKLGVEVEYLNPFRNVLVGPGISNEDIERDVHMLGQVVGLALRGGESCGIEIDLMPRDLVARKTFRRRLPYFAISGVGLILIMACWWLYYGRLNDATEDFLKRVKERRDSFVPLEQSLNQAIARREAAASKADALVALVGQKTRWVEVLGEVHSLMLDGMWLQSVEPIKGRDGRFYTEIAIRGFGFEDRLKPYESSSASAIEVFRNRLGESPLFADEATKVMGEGVIEEDFAFAREFLINISLVDPIPL